MATIAPPFSEAQLQSDFGFSYVFAMLELEQAFADRFDPLAAGIVTLKGDVAGTGSDVIRIENVDGLGFDQAMDALASETDTPTAKTLTTGYSTVTVAQYGLAYEDTYFKQIVTRDKIEAGISLDALKARLPENYAATIRSLGAAAMAGITTDVGAKTTSLSVDDMLDLGAAAIETLGASGVINAMIAPQQFTQLRSSASNHPAYQGSVGEFVEAQGFVLGQQTFANYLRLGVTLHLTDDIGTSGGGYDGGAFATGGLGYAVGNTSRVRPANPNGAIILGDRGLLAEEVLSGQNQQTRRFNAFAYLGVARADEDVYFQRGLLSST